MKEIFEGKSILITGGTGSVGSEILRQLLNYNPMVIRVLSNNEDEIFHSQSFFGEEPNVRFLLGDIRDKSRLKRAVENIDMVFHSAALKHVPYCEYNPFEAIKTNVIGTQNVIEACLDEEVDRMITISTDKAVNPTSTMGATKLLAERITVDANYYSGKRETTFSCVRFGNVLSSRGSVIPLFANQIKNGGPVTVTHKDMTRFVMSIEQSVSLVLQGMKIMKGSEIFALKSMSSLKIDDLAKAMIRDFGPKCGTKSSDIPIEYTGIRPGEKLYESLVTEEEADQLLETDNMFIILPNTYNEGYARVKVEERNDYDKGLFRINNNGNSFEYSSKSVSLLSIDEIIKLLNDNNLY